MLSRCRPPNISVTTNSGAMLGSISCIEFLGAQPFLASFNTTPRRLSTGRYGRLRSESHSIVLSDHGLGDTPVRRDALLTISFLHHWHGSGMTTIADATGRCLAKLAKQLPASCRSCGGSGLQPDPRWPYASCQAGLVSGVDLRSQFRCAHDLLALPSGAVPLWVYWSAIAGPRLAPVGKYGDFPTGSTFYHSLCQNLYRPRFRRRHPVVGDDRF